MEEDGRDTTRRSSPGAPAERSSPPREGGRESTRPSGGRAPTFRSKRTFRLVFAAIWIALQLTLVATAGRRADGAFGFRMFNESSTLRLALYREVDGPFGVGRQRVHVDDGVWNARAPDGTTRRLTWYDRVPTPFWPFDREFHASYGANAQLARLRAALDDVATHLPLDAETHRLILDVSVRRNGREPYVVELASPERLISRDGAREGGR